MSLKTNEHCGDCNKYCDPSDNYHCVKIDNVIGCMYCESPNKICGDKCMDLNTDENCGDCGKTCQNEGTCSELKCQCTGGWEGETYEKSKCEKSWQNGGTCIGKNECRCAAGWEGETCEKRMIACEKDSDCRVLGENFFCDSASGYRCLKPCTAEQDTDNRHCRGDHRMSSRSFVTCWKIKIDKTLQFYVSVHNATIDWGDGTSDNFFKAWGMYPTHEYKFVGEYDVTVTVTIPKEKMYWSIKFGYASYSRYEKEDAAVHKRHQKSL